MHVSEIWKQPKYCALNSYITFSQQGHLQQTFLKYIPPHPIQKFYLSIILLVNLADVLYSSSKLIKSVFHVIYR